MKILLVTDGSLYSEMAGQMIKALRLPADTEISILTVVPEPTFLGGITLDAIIGSQEAKEKANDAQQERAIELVARARQALGKVQFKVDTMIRWGNPAEVILSEVESENASLIIMGVKGLTDPAGFRLGSVALKVTRYASASVLLVRNKTVSLAEEPRKTGKITAVKRVLLATDGSKYADEVTRLLQALPLPRRTEVIVLTALHSHHEPWWKAPTLHLGADQETLDKIQATEEAEARKIIARAEKQFRDSGYGTMSVIQRGEASDCIIATAMDHSPDIIALGSKGLTGIESYVLGSVTERIARYANCSVLVGRGSH